MRFLFCINLLSNDGKYFPIISKGRIMKYVLLLLPLLFVGCGIVQISKDYTPPSKKNKIINKTIINGSKDVVWKKVISNLSQNFFVVNNLDKESGFINVSYSGDPEEYVD